MKKEKKQKGNAGKIVKTVLSSIAIIVLAIIVGVANTLLPTYGRMVTEVIGYRQSWNTPNEAKALDLQYNKPDFASSADLAAAEQALNEQIEAEGAVLLKHTEGYMPYAQGTEFSLFSRSSAAYLSGSLLGGGSTLKDALESRGMKVNEALWKFYSSGAGSEYNRGPGSINYGAAEDFSINEVPIGVITGEAGLTDTFSGTTAVFVLSRVVGEGRDMPRSMVSHTDIPEDRVKSYLEPDSVELGVIDYLNRTFSDIVLLVNTCGAMELGWVEDYANIHTVIYTGLTGSYGLNSIADILAGNTNPSGHLVDTYAYDAFSSPASQNYGSYYYSDASGSLTDYTYLSCEEGIYVGYKYYETRYEDAVLGQGNAGDYDYAATVQYPFGYGLSLTTFEWNDFHASWSSDTCTITVTVKNTGSVAGKEVVQVYLQTPYTEYDKENKVEKAAVQLVGYAKTGLLAPGAGESVTVTFDRSELKAYDYTKAKTYIVDAGDYYVTAADNAHSAVNNILAAKGKTVADGMTEDGNAELAFKFTVDALDTTTYSVDTRTGKPVTNEFDDASGDLNYLTRADWTGSFPVHDGTASSTVSTWGNEINGTDANGAPASYEWTKTASAELIQRLSGHNSGSPVAASSLSDKPVYGAKNGLGLPDLRGLNYNDPKWEELLDELTPEDYQTIITSSGYGTVTLTSVNKPYAMDADAANGLVFGGSGIAYSGINVLAQTWNIDLAKQLGNLIGNSALLGSGVIGWYSPAINIHRTPFSGRNNEYPSEDGFQAGYVASAEVYEAAKKGMYTYIKHFVLNDQENHRGDGGDEGAATWNNEQAIREIYLKPFEMCVKLPDVPVSYAALENGNYTLKTGSVPATNALMTSFNRIGATWTGGHYDLITGVLRGEWGFNGFVITDANSYLGHMDRAQMIEAGGDGSLRYLKDEEYTFNKDSSADYHYARQAAHHHLYTVANSSAMNGSAPGSVPTGIPTDRVLRIVLSIVPLLLIAILTYFNVRRFKKKSNIEVIAR